MGQTETLSVRPQSLPSEQNHPTTAAMTSTQSQRERAASRFARAVMSLAVAGVLGILDPDSRRFRGRIVDHRSGPASGHVVALAGLLTTEVSGPKMLG